MVMWKTGGRGKQTVSKVSRNITFIYVQNYHNELLSTFLAHLLALTTMVGCFIYLWLHFPCPCFYVS